MTAAPDDNLLHDWRIDTEDDAPKVVEMKNSYTDQAEPYHQFFCMKCKRGVALPVGSFRGLPAGPCIPKRP